MEDTMIIDSKFAKNLIGKFISKIIRKNVGVAVKVNPETIIATNKDGKVKGKISFSFELDTNDLTKITAIRDVLLEGGEK